MKRRIFRTVAVVLVIALMTCLFAACGNSSDAETWEDQLGNRSSPFLCVNSPLGYNRLCCQ